MAGTSRAGGLRTHRLFPSVGRLGPASGDFFRADFLDFETSAHVAALGDACDHRFVIRLCPVYRIRASGAAIVLDGHAVSRWATDLARPLGAQRDWICRAGDAGGEPALAI